MRPKREFRHRAETEVEVLDALVDRNEEGMTVLELRAHVDAPIDDLEAALSALKSDGLIRVDAEGERTLIHPHERVLPEGEPDEPEPSLVDRVREWLPL